MLRKWGMFVLMLLAAPTLIFAQNTGKISGVVTDGDTGDPLPGAQVILAGTTLGTITDVDGNYFIIGVPVGTYDVQASFVGYASETRSGVDVSSGYTQELNFVLLPGLELDEIVVEYERPLIQKDAIGVPKIVSAEEIVNLPVRGTANVAKIQAGVVSEEGSGTLNIRGGRGGEVTYYIDGVKVFGTAGVPQSAVQEQEMLIGSISARYGDAMSGIINITTKSGSRRFFGSFEGITSEAFDDFGYNLLSGAIGGPVLGDKMNFFLSAEYLDQTDNNPRAFGQLKIKDLVMDDLNAFPTSFAATDMDGNELQLSIPATLADSAYMLFGFDADFNPVPETSDGFIKFSDGTAIAIPEGATIDSYGPVMRATLLTGNDYSIEDAKRKRSQNNLAMSGNLTFNVLDNARMRVGGRYNTGSWDNAMSNRRILSYQMQRISDRDDYQLYGTWTHYLSNSTFYQLQFDFSDRKTETYDPRFGTDFNDFFRLADIDEDAFQTMRGYKNVQMIDQEIADVDGDVHTVSVPRFHQVYKDNQGLPGGDDVIFTLIQAPGGRFNGYTTTHNQQFRFTASATTQIGLHQLEFGGEYEKREYRNWNIGSGLAKYFNDGNAELAVTDDRLNPNGYTDYFDVPLFIIDNQAGGYGFNTLGTEETDFESLEGFINTDIDKPAADRQLSPWEPIYYGGYLQDKIEFRDIVLNLGIRVDVFDNNLRVLKDKFSRRPIVRAGDLGISLPSTIDTDYAVYFAGDDVFGYRDLSGNFYDETGKAANAGDISLNSAPNQTDSQISEAMFSDYDPDLTFMPRIGVSFPVTDRALFFASYGVVAQRPSERNFSTIAGLAGTGGLNNTGLKPEKTTSYELGFRQRLGARAAFTISGFFRQVENLIQIRELRFSTPSVYRSSENVDFGTIKGVEFGFDLRRTNNLSANMNYTLSYADGTGSFGATTGTIVWVSETPPNFISPLDFDQRHKLNISMDYRMGAGEGPTIFGSKMLQNTGFNVLFTAGSGFPYTAVTEPENLAGGAKAERPRGAINGDYSPGQSRIDIRVDKRFSFAGAQMSAFIWVQNLLDQQNINNVWRYTGLPETDGFLATAAGIGWAENKPQLATDLYNHRNRGLGNVGIPRLTRIGVRVDF